MKHKLILSTLAVFFLGTCLSFTQVNLKYKWEEGSSYRFKANQNDDVTMSAMGMNMRDIFDTETIFSLKVLNVLSDGKAEGILYIESFKVTNKNGETVANLDDIPAEALKSLVEVDAKGKFTFKRIVYLLVEGGKNILVSASAKADLNSASASAQVGDQKLSIHAEFDPKSGTIKAGYSMETVKNPLSKTVKIKEDAQKIDILPLEFLDMMVLPEETITPGSSFQIKMMELIFTTKVNNIVDNMANLDLNIKTDRSQGSSTNSMNNMMGNTGSMDMGGGMSMDMSGGAPKIDINGDISCKFDVGKGIFNSLSGKIISSTKGMGLNMKAITTLKMSLL